MSFSEGLYFQSVHQFLCLTCSACLDSMRSAPIDLSVHNSNQSAESFLNLQISAFVSLKLYLSGCMLKPATDAICAINLTKKKKKETRGSRLRVYFCNFDHSTLSW